MLKSGGVTTHIFNTDIYVKVTEKVSPRPLHSPVKTPCYPLNKFLAGRLNQSGHFTEQEIVFPFHRNRISP
jgi:hypothetical protein